MKLLKIVLLCLTFIVSACGAGKRASSDPRANQKTARSCIPESELLASGIIGGQTVSQEDYDSKLVMMVISDGHLCTAAAVAPNVLLTAAHCLVKKDSTIVAFYSSLSCESGFKREQNSVAVQNIIVHEAYDPNLSEDHADQTVGDLGLVVLEKNIPEGYPIYKLANPQNISGSQDIYLYGYGRQDSNGGGAGILRKTKINSNSYSIDVANKKVGINQSNGTGICQGDSGGPSLIDMGGELQILGINSYVVGPKDNLCGDRAFQTLADSYRDWVTSKLNLIGNGTETNSTRDN